MNDVKKEWFERTTQASDMLSAMFILEKNDMPEQDQQDAANGVTMGRISALARWLILFAEGDFDDANEAEQRIAGNAKVLHSVVEALIEGGPDFIAAFKEIEALPAA